MIRHKNSEEISRLAKQIETIHNALFRNVNEMSGNAETAKEELNSQKTKQIRDLE